MIVNTTHAFNISSGFKTYQVVDNQEGDLKPIHRYTVMEWDRTGFNNGARLVASDVSIYAESKMEAVKKYQEKYKKAK